MRYSMRLPALLALLLLCSAGANTDVTTASHPTHGDSAASPPRSRTGDAGHRATVDNVGARTARHDSGARQPWNAPAVVRAPISPRVGAAAARRLAAFGALPLAFEANHGQTDRRVRFLARGHGYTIFLTATDAVLSLTAGRKGASCAPGPRPGSAPVRRPISHAAMLLGARAARPPGSVTGVMAVERCGRDGSGRAARAPSPSAMIHDGGRDARAPGASAVIRLRLVGANPRPRVAGGDRLPGADSYLAGPDPRGWRRGIPTYAGVAYHDVYKGVDLVYHGKGGRLEYDFVLAPGASPRAIRLAVEGAQAALDRTGGLLLRLPGGEVRWAAPVVYQQVHGARRAVAGRYALLDAHTVGFVVGRHDARALLVVDPVLVYSTYLGGSAESSSGMGDGAYGLAIDPANPGRVLVTGVTYSPTFPTTTGAYSRTLAGGADAFITRLSLPQPLTPGIITTVVGTGARGNGGNGGNGGPATAATLTTPADLAVDRAGNLYIDDAGYDFVSSALVREVVTGTGIITTVAGTGRLDSGPNGDGGPATLARLDFPEGVTLDAAGNLYIADTGNRVVREVIGVGRAGVRCPNPPVSHPATFYVAPGGDDANPCTAPAAPCRTVNGALSRTLGGNTVSVAAGAYHETVAISHDLTLRGDPAGGTVITGTADGPTVSVSADAAVTVTAVTIEGGGPFGGGVRNLGTLLLASSVISGNSAGYGGGIGNSSALTVTLSTISSNTASNGAGASALADSARR